MQALIALVSTLNLAISMPETNNSGAEVFEAKLIDVAPEATEDGFSWRITVEISSQLSLVDRAFFAHASTAGLERLKVDLSTWHSDHRVQIVLPAPRSGLPTDVTINLYSGTTRSLLDRVGTTLHFQSEGDDLVPISAEQFLERDIAAFSAGLQSSLGPEPRYRDLAPWDNPDIRPEDRAYAYAMRDRLQSEEAVGQRIGALVANPSQALDPTSPPDAGCSNTTGVGLLAAFGILLLILRRPACFALLLISPVLLHGSDANAVVVYGYVGFWDSRDNKSDLAGSRLPTCVTASTNCSIADQPTCCFRPLPNATLVVKQFGVVYASVEINEGGFYIASVDGGDFNYSYEFRLRYERTSPPGTTVLTLSSASPPVVAEQLLAKFNLSGYTFVSLPDLRVNQPSDTTSSTGNAATMWTTVTETQNAIGLEGDYRYLRLAGKPVTDPEDPIILYLALSKDGWNCATSVIRNSASASRSTAPAAGMGGLYLARVVGCNPTVYDLTYAFASFPPVPTPARPAAGAEGVSLHYAFTELAVFLSRWNPTYTNRDDMQSAGGLNVPCVAEALTNSNDAAWVRNASLALWEWRDVDTSAADAGYSDTCSIKTKFLLDGLHSVSTTAGSQGQDQTSAEPYFVPGAQCDQYNSNQGCPSGDACTLRPAGVAYCASGDPHGGNLADLASHLATLGAVNSWPGHGNYVQTLISSPCIGVSDDTYPYTGGFRAD